MTLTSGTCLGVYEVAAQIGEGGMGQVFRATDTKLSVDEIAEVLRVSPITVMREWKSANTWLYRELAGPTANGH